MTDNKQALAPYLARPPRRWEATLPPETEAGLVTDVMALLKRQWRTIAGTIGVLVGLTLAYCFTVTPTYLATANVLIEGKGPAVLNPQNDGDQAQSPFTSTKYDYYQTQFTMLRSPSLVRKVIGEQGLDKTNKWEAFFVPFKKPAPIPQLAADAPTPPALVTQYLWQLTILPIRGTRLVSVQFASPDAKLSADVANAHAKLFVSTGLERVYESMDQVRNFLQGKLTDLEGRMQTAEKNLAKFQSTHHLMPIDVQKDVASERLVDLSKRLTQAQGELIQIDAEYELVKKGNRDSLPAVLHSPLIQTLRENVDRLEVEHSLMAMKFRPTYPRLRQLSGQLAHAHELLDAETTKVVKGIEVKRDGAQAMVDQLQTELEKQRQALLDRKDTEGEFLTLLSDVETTRALHDNLLTRIKDLNVAGEAAASNITVAEPATPPTNPQFPGMKLFLVLATLTGTILGAGLAFLRDAADQRIRNPKDVQRATGLGTLAIVPNFDTMMEAELGFIRRHLPRPFRRAKHTYANGHAPADANGRETPPLILGNGHTLPPAEAYRSLRTSLLLSRAMSPRVIVVSSAEGEEGKTTTAVNTAAALATCGAKVLLIDADLRQPRCHFALGLSSQPGLSDFLTGKLEVEPIRPTHVPNLMFLPAGDAVANPTELLTSWLMCKLLQEARDRYEFVVLDSPPLLAVSDGLLLANLADGVVFVAESGKSRQDLARLAIQRVLQTGGVPVGVVLNKGVPEAEYYYKYAAPAARAADEILPPIDDDAEGRE